MDAKTLVKTETIKNNLQNDLLTAVKECQKKYGTRLELATEIDPLVFRVCYCFEAIFNHGLKKDFPKKPTRKLHVIKFNEKPSFWLCISNILSLHEKDRYNSLHNVKSNWGKGRSWLRSALNERSLERYLLTVTSNEDLLDEYYDNFAFLRDQEKSYVLSTAAAGLAPILFAISIDREDLDRRTCGSISLLTSEEIILTSPMDVVKVNDLRRKIPSNVIEFDDVSEEIGNYDEVETTIRKEMNVSSLVELAEDASQIIENDTSVANKEADDSLGVGLRPVNDDAVGELIPVPADINESDNSIMFPDCQSEDGMSVGSTDEQNLLKIYEQGKEELRKQISVNEKLNSKVHELNRENEVLKHQLRRYVSAVQMLRQDDADHTYEAQLYERKLVQVAEMHGELMELNQRLQISLLAKEEVVKRLQEELVLLRGPLPSDDFALHKLVSLWVPSVFLTGRYSDPHHVYQIHFRIGSEEWNIYRRYAQIYSFHQKLKKEFSIASTFQFPPKKTIGNKEANFVEDRRKKLQMYLRQVINFVLTHDSHLAGNPSKALFVSKVQFFSEQYKETTQSKSNSIFYSCLEHTQNNYDDNISIQYSGL